LLFGLVFIYYKSRIKRIEKQKEFLEKQVELRTIDLSRSNFKLEQEIQDRKKAEEEIKKTNELLLESNITKDKLFSIISHDLRGPVGNVVSTLKIFSAEKDLSEELREEFISGMIESAESTYIMLENLLDWARTQRNSINIIFENIELAPLVDEVLHFLSGIAGKKSISIVSNIQKNIFVYCDYDTVSTVIRNLTSNAIKFTPENGNIKFSALEENDKIIISISDNGVGMPKNVLKNMFSKTNIISTKGTQGEKGTGMGLLLCMDFIRKNEGEIWAESEIGNGTTFYFTLRKIPGK
jgi:K+-sensing histidine kinase KdpD